MGETRRIADRYELLAEIGAGGMGVVWRARDHRLGRDVALKLLAAGALGNDVARARLIREARAAAKLQHAGIVHVYDVGETDDGGAFLVMELIAGRTLRELIDEGSMSLATKVDVIVGIAEALAYAHAEGIIHRDVKPDNVLVRKNGRPVVLDFGLAKPVPVGFAETVAESASLTKDGHIVGTPAYLAPEQVRSGDVGPAADQFALAVTAYEMLSGALPWRGRTVLEVLASMLADTPSRLEVPGVPPAASEVLCRALQKDANARYATVTELGEALAEACGVGPRSRPSGEASAATSAPSKPQPSVAKTESSALAPAAVSNDAPRPRASTRGLQGLAIAALGALAVFAFRASSPPTNEKNDAGKTVAAPSELTAVACPIFSVTRDELKPPHGWLGAAAATLACDHARVYLGGLPSAAVPPAELVKGIPREPADNVPADPFCADGAAEESRKAAAARGLATIEGALRRDQGDFAVDVVVRSKTGAEIARGQGTGYELFVAISNAMRSVKAAFGGVEPSPFQREWLRVSSVEAADDYLDATVAILSEDNIESTKACDRFVARPDVKADIAYLVRAVCAERLKRPAPEGPPPAIDESSPGALVTTIAAHRSRGGPAETLARMNRLVPLLERTTKPEERTIVAGAIGELAYLAGDLTRAGSFARMGVQASPTLVDLRGTPWHRLSFSTEFDRTIARPHASWLAWEPVAVWNAGTHGATYRQRIAIYERGYELARRGTFATSYADGLTRLGAFERARGIAEQLDSDYLRVRVLMAQRFYGRAIEQGLAILRALPGDNSSASGAFRLLSAITEASRMLGKRPAFTEEILGKYLFVDPPRVKVGVIPFLALAYVCTDAPPTFAKKCVKRLREAYARGEAGAVVGSAPALLEGSQHWVDGDLKGAATAWRPLLRESGPFLDESFRHLMVEAFEASGASDLAIDLDRDYLDFVDSPNAFDFALVREAFRAEKRGDTATARKLAQHSLNALRFADQDVPAAKDLSALLSRLK
jgi:eukaryotic-like serine/threonine-protein kinase